jgi:broad-specificity NMP kinase
VGRPLSHARGLAAESACWVGERGSPGDTACQPPKSCAPPPPCRAERALRSLRGVCAGRVPARRAWERATHPLQSTSSPFTIHPSLFPVPGISLENKSPTDPSSPQLLDTIEEQLSRGGNIIDYHACDLFPASWIDLVVVLRTSTEVLYDRLKARGYKEAKLQENMDAEIMQVILEEARDGFEGGLVWELASDGVEEMEGNAERVEGWVDRWRDAMGTEEGNGKEDGKWRS